MWFEIIIFGIGFYAGWKLFENRYKGKSDSQKLIEKLSKPRKQK